NIDPGDLPALLREAETSPASVDDLLAAHQGLYGEATRVRGERYKKLGEELTFLRKVLDRQEREDDEREVKVRGEYYPGRRARALRRSVEEEIKDLQAVFARVDRQVFLTYYRMAVAVGPGTQRELKER